MQERRSARRLIGSQDRNEEAVHGVDANDSPTPTSSTANPPSNESWNASPSAKTTSSGIVNDANLWATETMNNPKYPLELFLRVITVSLETMKIVDGLPKLDI